MKNNKEIFELSKKFIPGGVNSPVRAYNAVGINPPIIKSAKDGYIFDVEDNKYIDLVNSWGANILGHANEEVVSAINSAASKGISFGASTENELKLAEKIINTVQKQHQAGVNKLRLVSSGTEATMTAIRLARGFTNRTKIVKFDGHYHGHSDSLLVKAGSGIATLDIKDESGIPQTVQNDTIIIEYNNLEQLQEVFQNNKNQIAAVIVEAAAANMGVVPPINGFNQKISEIAKQNGTLFILDEVLTGFRVSSAGWWKYDEYDYLPDLFTFGKVIGGGLPVAAIGGQEEIMDFLAPVGPVYQAGTLSGNPVAVASGLATLHLLDEKVYEKLDFASENIVLKINELLQKYSIPGSVETAGNLFSLRLGVENSKNIVNFAGMQKMNIKWYGILFRELLQNRIFVPPSIFEAWFVSAQTNPKILDELFIGLEKSFKVLSENLRD